jgi:hypothetical protein
MNIKFSKNALLVILFTITNVTITLAQCAMCKSVVGSNKDAGGNIANGLNTGILYLMAVPYLLLMILGIYIFRRRIVQKFPALKSLLKVN